MATPPNYDPNAPFDPTNVNDPRYDPSRDPRYDPRWQKAQQRMWRDQMRAQQHQVRATRKAQQQAWKAHSQMQRDQWRAQWGGQRHTSIVGPLLLIAVGVIFFLIHTGRIAMVNFFGWYSHWWPLLLILIGLLRLAEWGIDRARAPQDAPPVRYTTGGGVVFLVILLAIGGIATHAMEWRADNNGVQFFGFHGDDGMQHLFGQKHEEDAPSVEQVISANGSLTIDSPHGDVTITGTSDDGKVHMSAHKQVYTNSDRTATERLRSLQPTLEGSPDSLTLRVPAVDGGGADVTLLVPATTRVLLNSDHGDVHVTNMKSPLSVTSNNGDIEVAAITGNVQVHANNRHRDINIRSVAGDVTVDGTGDEVTLSDITGTAHVNGDYYSGGHFQHIGGESVYHSSRSDVRVAHLAGEMEIGGNELTIGEAVGPMLVQTRSRNITLDKISGDVKVVGNHGDVELHLAPPMGVVTVDNQNGNVNVSLPSKAKFSLQAETSDGDTHSDFDGVKSDGRGMLSGSVNGGGPQVKVNTSHGDINISGNSMPPLPPLPPMPKLTGFGAVGVPSPPTSMPPSAIDAINDAKQQTADAKQQAREAVAQAQQALKDAQEKVREAEKEARDAAKDK